MPIKEHPHKGSILTCDFNTGFKLPEMVKRRPVIIISPKINTRAGLCTVVPLSTTKPDPIMPYHAEIILPPPSLPHNMSQKVWVKGDMINAVGFHRLDFIRLGKDSSGKRIYYYTLLDNETIHIVKSCILRGMGLAHLTKHL